MTKQTADRPAKTPKKSLVITKVAPGSPAAALGLRPGDLFVSINGIAALDAKTPDILVAQDTATYVFISEQDGAQITVKTPALPMGIRTEAASADILASYESKPLHEFEGIEALWEREDYVEIRQVAKNATSKGVIGKIGLSKSKNPLADVLVAICDVEEGKGKDPYQVIVDFEKQHGNNIRSDIAGIVTYYVARQHRENGNTRKYDHLMRWVMESPHSQESPRLKADADANNVYYVSESIQLGKKFGPVAEMEYLEGGTGTGLVPDILRQTNPGQVAPVCLMLTYRGNGPYDDALKVYQAIYPFVKDRMRPLLVLTSVRDKSRDDPASFATEDALIAAGVPITILFDPLSYWADMIVAGAPENIAVDDNAQIFWHDSLHDDYAYWDMLSLAQDQ